jgi:hypothetical protein
MVVRADERETTIRRRTAPARVIYAPETRGLVAFIDAPPGPADPAHAKTFVRWSVRGEWPLAERWEGELALDKVFFLDYSMDMGAALRMDGVGVILIFGTDQSLEARDAAAAVGPLPMMVVTGRAGPKAVVGTFDALEAAWRRGGDGAIHTVRATSR